MRKPTICVCKNKISAFVFATGIVQFPLAIFCAYIAQFESNLSNLFGNHIVGFLMTRLLRYLKHLKPLWKMFVLRIYYFRDVMNYYVSLLR